MDQSMPALERALAILRYLADHPAGASVAQLHEACAIPRATVYRILRVLRDSRIVVPSPRNPVLVVLGDGLVRLAEAVPRPRDLVACAQPIMDALAAQTGESVKLVIREGREAVTIAVAHAARDHRIALRIGSRVPLHIGGSQRLLLSEAPVEVQEAVLSGPLPAQASGTITDPAALRAQLPGLRARGWVEADNEGVDGVGACGIAVRGPDGGLAAVIVSVFVLASHTVVRRREIKSATRLAASALERALGAGQGQEAGAY